ncbi:MAG TPA: pitrilysin family protein [Rhodanobacteraceae bacterium]|nr:pitrilysin family protein [Rhodanobacteraceae bacterium]
MIRPRLIAAALAAALSLPALAVELPMPAPGPAKSVHIPAAADHTLDNGLRVIVVHRAGLPLVTVNFVLRSGSEADPAALPGTASMAAGLLTQGTSSRSAPEIAQQAAALGGSIDVAAGWDETDAGITVTTPKLGAALNLLADVVRNPAFHDADIERVRKQTLDGLRLAWSQPGSLASMVARRAVFGASAYGHPASGTPTSVAAIQRDNLLALHHTWYRPDNAILVFAGDISTDAALALAKKTFGDWAKPATALPTVAVEKAESKVPAKLAIDLHGSGQAGVVVAKRAIARSAPDYYAGVVANMVLGGSYSARMNEEIRIKRGLSYGARSSLGALRDDGWLTTSVQTKNPSAAEVVSLSLAQVESLSATPPTAAEITARKATLIGGFGRSLDTTAGLAAQIGERAVNNVPLDEINQHIPRIEAITPKDVVAFAKAHLGPEGTHVVVVGDASQYGTALKKLWPKVTPVASTKLKLSRADLGL